MSTSATDPITLEVMRNAFYSIAEEMNASLVRASYSTNIKDRRDCSCAIYTATGEVVAQSESGTPVHLGTMHGAVRTALDIFPLEQWEPGDAIASNLPYPAGPGHLNDLCIMSPIYYRGEIVAIAANQAHHVDMGGYATGSMPFGVTEIYQEGLQIPPVRLFRGGRLDRDLWALMSQNIRTPFEVHGDLEAQYAANTVGEHHLGELGDKYGMETVQRYLQEMLDYTERRMRAALGAIPPGSYSFEDVIEGDGIVDKDYTIRATLEAGGDSMRIDFSATDDAARGPLNCRWPSVAACVYYVVKAVLDPDLPSNAGAYRAIDIVTREGSMLSAVYPNAVCNANIITTQRIVDVMMGALSKAVPKRIAAASSGTMNLLNVGGMDPRDGSYFQYIETYGGGQGAGHDTTGMDAVQNHMTNTRNAPVEAIEAAYPLRVETYGLVPDSEGPGEHRGGLGLRRALRVLGKEVQLTVSSDRARVAPWGLFGGRPGGVSRCWVVGPNGREDALPSKVTTYVDGGHLIVTETPGGGGWGSPRLRDAEAVRSDVLEGMISPERAREVYGVAVDSQTMELDEAETRRLRDGSSV
jgi:N-methylhydantoinase B